MLTLQSARLWYSADDPVHGFDHVQRVYRLAEYIASFEGADLEIVQAAVLLHDVDVDRLSQRELQKDGKADLHRENHHHASADFADQILRQEGWVEESIFAVRHCILSHRFRDNIQQPQTLEARVLFDADKLDAIGAVGVSRAIAYALRAGHPAYAVPSQSFINTGQLEPGEPQSAYHEYIFKLMKLKTSLYTATGSRLAKSRHQVMQAYFENLDAEMRGEI